MNLQIRFALVQSFKVHSDRHLNFIWTKLLHVAVCFNILVRSALFLHKTKSIYKMWHLHIGLVKSCSFHKALFAIWYLLITYGYYSPCRELRYSTDFKQLMYLFICIHKVFFFIEKVFWSLSSFCVWLCSTLKLLCVLLYFRLNAFFCVSRRQTVYFFRLQNIKTYNYGAWNTSIKLV